MSNQEIKMKEATYFYNLMEGVVNEQTIQEFQFLLSAFLTAARSVLQYTYDYADTQNRKSDYNTLLIGKPTLSYFKRKRDFNIHTAPVTTSQHINLSVFANITVTVRAEASIVRINADGTIDEHEELNKKPINDPEQVIKRPDLPLPTSTVTFHFSDWPGSEDIITLSKLYITELQDFILDAKRTHLIL